MDKLIKIALSIFASLGLLKIASIIPFNRMAADDYSSAIVGRDGLWNSVVFTYKTFMGRFSAVFIETPFATLMSPDGKIALYSIITFGLLFLAILIFIKRLFKFNLKNISLYLISIALFAILYQLTPNKSESWYWMTGSVVYLWPIIFFTFGVSHLFLTEFKIRDYVLACIFIFFGTAFNEAFGLLTLAMLFVYAIFSFNNINKRKLAIAMFISSLLSFLIMFLSPGNEVRRAGYGSSPMSYFGSLLYSLADGPNLYFSLVFQNLYLIVPIIIVLACLFKNKLITKINENAIYVNIFLTFLGGIISSVIFMIPAYASLGRVQPDRSQITIAFVILLQVIFLSKFISQTKVINNNLLIFVGSMWLIYSSNIFTKSLASDLYIAKNYSIHFDQMINTFQKASEANDSTTEIQVSLPDGGLIAKLIDPVGVYSYKNLSLSEYYKIGKVVTVENE